MFSDPKKNIEQFVLGEDMHVADFGSGSGAYSIAAAFAVGADGKVYAIDAKPELLSRLKKEAEEARLSNIEVINGNLEDEGGSNLRDGAMDAVIVSNILFQINDKSTFVSEVKRVLHSGGRVLVVDWKESFGGAGPQPENIIKEEAIKALFVSLGFSYEKNIDAGAYHYGIVFKKS